MPILILASRSPRRLSLLREAGLSPIAISPPFSDPPHPDEDAGSLTGSGAKALAMELAGQKAVSLKDAGVFKDYPDAVILAADTICVSDDGKLVGQPSDRAHAGRIIRRFNRTVHDVVTGVALLSLADATPELFGDFAHVTVGDISEDMIERYLDTDGWQGKAGAYNLSERQGAGWPITVDGDPGTVVGLPLRMLLPRLNRRGIH